VKFYRAAPTSTILAVQGTAGDVGRAGVDTAELPGAAVIIAIRAADLVSPAGRPAAGDERTALVLAGTPRIRTGDHLLFVKVVAAAPAVIRRDGRVQAGGHPACHARLGALEQQLDDLLGPGVIDEIAAQATLTGKVKGKARRAMTAAFAIRASVLMSVMPADYAEVMAALAGDLILVPWQRPYQVPTAKVLSAWREAMPAGSIRDAVLLPDSIPRATISEVMARSYLAPRAPRGPVESHPPNTSVCGL
jgi:hypothetical protein